MTKHLFAKWVDGKVYRDREDLYMNDNEFHEILNKRLMPEGYAAFHYSSERQWKAVLALPVYAAWECPIRDEIWIINSRYGVCRRCRIQPAEGLWKGKFPVINRTTGALTRTSPYKGYVCLQCAQHLEEETGIKGNWLK